MAIYYVATNGSDGAAGTIGAPWATIAHALTVSAPNDSILVRGGTYNQSLHFLGGVIGSTWSGMHECPTEIDCGGRYVSAYQSEVPSLLDLGGNYANLTLRGLTFREMMRWQVARLSTFEDCTFVGGMLLFPNGDKSSYPAEGQGWKSTYGNVFRRCIFGGSAEEQTGIDNNTPQTRTTITGVGAGSVTLASGTPTNRHYLIVLDGEHAGQFYRVTSVLGGIVNLDTTNFSTDGLVGATCQFGFAGAENVWENCTINTTKDACFWEQPSQWNGKSYLGNFPSGSMGAASGLSFWQNCYGNTVRNNQFVGDGLPNFPVGADTNQIGISGVRDLGTQLVIGDAATDVGFDGHPARVNSRNRYIGNTFAGIQAPLIVGMNSEVWYGYHEMAPEYFDAFTAHIAPEYGNFAPYIVGNDFGGGIARVLDCPEAVFADGQNGTLLTTIDAPFIARYLQAVDGSHGSRLAGANTLTTLAPAPTLYDLAPYVSGTSDAPVGTDAGVRSDTGDVVAYIAVPAGTDAGLTSNAGTIPVGLGADGPYFDLAPYVSGTSDAPVGVDAGANIFAGAIPDALEADISQAPDGLDGGWSTDGAGNQVVALIPPTAPVGTDAGVSADVGAIPTLATVWTYRRKLPIVYTDQRRTVLEQAEFDASEFDSSEFQTAGADVWTTRG